MPTETKTFTLEELEAAKKEAAASAVAREKAQREKFVSKEEAEKNVEKAKQEAIETYKKEAEQISLAKQAFDKAGGNPEAFNDFYGANKNELDFTNDSTLEKGMASFKESKSYLFGGKSPEPSVGKEVEDNDDEYYPGTLQKKPK